MKHAHIRAGGQNLSKAYRLAAMGCSAAAAPGTAGALLADKVMKASPLTGLPSASPQAAVVPDATPPAAPAPAQPGAREAHVKRLAAASQLKAACTPSPDYDVMQFLHYDMDLLRNSSLHAVRVPRGAATAEAVAQPLVFAFKRYWAPS